MHITGLDLSEFILSVAAKLAHMGDEEQAAFFNAFAKELSAICETRHLAEMQAAYVSNHSSKQFKDFCAVVSHEDS